MSGRKVIVSCAITGSIHVPSLSPHLPITPEQIAASAVEAGAAGAAILHLHARDPETGQPSPDPDLFGRFLPAITAQSDSVVNITTGGGHGMTVEEREEPYVRNSDDFIFRNTFQDIEWIVRELGAHGTRFEFECYDVGHLSNLAHFADRGLVEPPFFVQTIFGILGGIAPTPGNLLHMKAEADRLFGDDYRWSVLAAGRHQMPLATMGAIAGSSVRVGLEDSIYLGKGRLAESNAEQVAKIVRILRELSLEIATPEEARRSLCLKGPDNTRIT